MGASVRRVSARMRTALPVAGAACESTRGASARFALQAIPAAEAVCKKLRRETRLIVALLGPMVGIENVSEAHLSEPRPDRRRGIYDYRAAGTRRGQPPRRETRQHPYPSKDSGTQPWQ